MINDRIRENRHQSGRSVCRIRFIAEIQAIVFSPDLLEFAVLHYAPWEPNAYGKQFDNSISKKTKL